MLAVVLNLFSMLLRIQYEQVGVGGDSMLLVYHPFKKFETFSFLLSTCCARLLNVVEIEAAIVGLS